MKNSVPSPSSRRFVPRCSPIAENLAKLSASNSSCLGIELECNIEAKESEQNKKNKKNEKNETPLNKSYVTYIKTMLKQYLKNNNRLYKRWAHPQRYQAINTILANGAITFSEAFAALCNACENDHYKVNGKWADMLNRIEKFCKCVLPKEASQQRKAADFLVQFSLCGGRHQNVPCEKNVPEPVLLRKK